MPDNTSPTLSDLLASLAEADTPQAVAESARLVITEASKANDTSALASALTSALDTSDRLARTAGVGTVRMWAVSGEAMRGLVRVMRQAEAEAADKAPKSGEPSATELSEAAKRYAGRTVSSADANRCKRASAVTESGMVANADRLSRAADLLAAKADDGPADAKAVSVLVWCEADAKVQTGSNRGKAVSTRAEAEAAKAKAKSESEAAAEAKATLAKAIGAAMQGDKAKRQQRIVVDGVTSLVTPANLDGADDAQIAATVAVLKAEAKRRADAKAEAKREAKAADAAKAETAKVSDAAKAKAETLVMDILRRQGLDDEAIAEALAEAE